MLETEIVKLREAVEALTAALEKNSLLPAPGEVPKNQVEPAPSEVPKNQDGVPIAVLKEATLKVSRTKGKETVRAKLNEMGATILTDFNAKQQTAFYNWAKEQVQ